MREGKSTEHEEEEERVSVRPKPLRDSQLLAASVGSG